MAEALTKLTDSERMEIIRFQQEQQFFIDTGLRPVTELALPVLADLASMEIEEKVPLYAELLYPGAFLIVGRPKVGKSWFLMQLALSAAESRPFLGFQCVTPGEVLVILAEDDDSRVKSRLQHMGYVNFPGNVSFITQQGFMALAKQYAPHMTFEQFLDQYLEGHPGVRYVFVDTETTTRQIWNGERERTRDTSRVTETDYSQTRAFDEIALKRKTFIGLVNHAKKRNGEEVDIHESINRSNTAFAGCSGSVVLADYPDTSQLDGNSRARVLGIRGRDLKDDVVLALTQREEDAQFENLGPYNEVRQTENEEEILKCVESLQEERGGAGYTSIEDVASELGRKTHTVKRAVSRMLEKASRRTWGRYLVATKRGRGGGIRLEPR